MRKPFLLLCLFAAAGSFSPGRAAASSPKNTSSMLSVRIFAVGHADSILLTTAGHAVLVDSARSHPALGDTFVTRRLVPHLRAMGIRSLSAFIITHPHFDHFGDPAELLRHVSFPAIHTNVDGAYFIPRFLGYFLSAPKVKYITLARGDRMAFGRLLLEVLHPSASVKNPTRSRDLWKHNNRSLVIRASYGRTRFLLTGDVGFNAERELVRQGRPGKVDVLKMGHHGKGSTSYELLKATRPLYAVASCGDTWRGQRDVLPSALIKRLRAMKVQLLRTDRDGDILFRTEGTTLTLTTFPSLARTKPSTVPRKLNLKGWRRRLKL